MIKKAQGLGLSTQFSMPSVFEPAKLPWRLRGFKDRSVAEIFEPRIPEGQVHSLFEHIRDLRTTRLCDPCVD